VHNANEAGGPPLNAADREAFLANLDNGPGEQTNLAHEHPNIVEQLRRLAPPASAAR
jgi:hypothetical protein